jgi:hypothetical protein
MRRLQLWKWHGKPTGLFLTRAIPTICLAMFTLRAAAGPLRIPLTEYFMPAWYQSGPNSFGRATILKQLQQVAGRQLVIVRYQPGRDAFEEWVYNAADIDAAKVVWARNMSPTENQELIKYFKDRHVWVLDADEKPPKLSPYAAPDTSDLSGTSR